MYSENRPWGKFIVMNEDSDHKVKTIIVNPKCRLSLQSHKHRFEHWIVICGDIIATVGDEVKTYSRNAHIYIPAECKHRVENPGDTPAMFIEVQTGDYFGEDDITRYEDDYDRECLK